MSTTNSSDDLCLSQESEVISLYDSLVALDIQSTTTSKDESTAIQREVVLTAKKVTVEYKSVSQVEVETRAKQKKIDEQVATAEKTSLCFLIDCTGSMSPWINKVKNNIKFWSKRLHAQYTNMELHVAFVRYTDYDQPEHTRTTKLDFTKDLDRFHRFVDSITTPSGVGGDTAEDVFGGLDAVLKLSWPREGTKVMIHITDAPCHGRQYYDLKVNDDHPQGDPAGLQLDHLMKQFAQKEITYYFGYIKKASTLKMITAFNSLLKSLSRNIHSIQQFDANDPNKLLEGVFRSVTCSIVTTIEILTSGGAREPRQYTIEEGIPNWDILPTRSVMVTPPPTIGSGAKIEVPSRPMNVKIAPQPFDEGGQKIVHHAFDVDKEKHIVLKRSKWADPRSNSIKRCLETAQVHAIAANFCAEFNRTKPFDAVVSEIQFLPVGIMQVTEDDKTQYFTYEQYLRGSGYRKFNSSFQYLPEQDTEDDLPRKTCQAFSHYTWQRSDKMLVICDLQGMIFGARVVLTDPVIHHTNVLCHGSTNLGTKGIEQFFRNHKCNDICRAMELKHPGEALECIKEEP